MSTAKTTMHPAASSRRNYMLDVPAAIRQRHQSRWLAKLKALLRKAAARSSDDLWRALDDICGLFDPQDCWNYLKSAGYVVD
ncbi:hypothetical protein NKH19_32895, partial [Mesorhizobium sp. M1338]